MIEPILLGGGKRIFPADGGARPLQLVNCRHRPPPACRSARITRRPEESRRNYTPRMTIDGYVATEFEPVIDAFAQNFDDRGEVGAAVCVYLDGEPVVDLWGGLADPTNGTRWQEDTLVLVYSATKGVTAICANLLIERGLLDPDARVASLWPEFAANGKGAITVGADDVAPGGPAATSKATSRSSRRSSWQPMVDALAAQQPIWEPGTKHGYHMRTYGWLVGEIIRRADPQHRTPGTFWRDEIGDPLGVDFWIGLPEELEPRVAQLVPPKADLREALAPFGDDLLLARVFSNPGGHFNYDEMWNTRALHAAELPSSNGIGSARGLARLYASCVGEVDGRRTLPAETVAGATLERACGKDEVLMIESCFGLGLHARSFVRRGQPARRVRARGRGRFARLRRSRHRDLVRVRDERSALRRHRGRSPQRGARARRLPGARTRGADRTGASRSTRGSSGRPSTRSPTMLRWISSVPPRIEIDGAVRNSVCHSPCGSIVRVGAEDAGGERGVRLEQRGAAQPSCPNPPVRAARPARCRAPAGRCTPSRATRSTSRASASRTSGSDARAARSARARSSRSTSSSPLVPPAVDAPRSYDRHVSATRQPSPTSPMRSASATTRVVEEDLGEVRVAVHLAQRPDVDARRRAGRAPNAVMPAVLRDRRVVPGEQQSRTARTRPGSSTPSGRSRATRRRRGSTRVASPARSDPAPGSENSWHQISSPVAIFGSQRAHWSGRPCASSVGPTSSSPTRYG